MAIKPFTADSAVVVPAAIVTVVVVFVVAVFCGRLSFEVRFRFLSALSICLH